MHRSVQTKLKVSQPGDQLEQEADHIAEQFTRASYALAWPDEPITPLSHSEPLIQRLPTNGTAPQDLPSAVRLIVEDDAAELASGQMRKSAFLDDLRRSVCSTADAALSAVGQTTEGCPYVERWIGYYRGRSSQQVERALRRYVPEASRVTSASAYVPLVAERVRQAVIAWARTGEVTGVPTGVSAEAPETSSNEPATGGSATESVMMKSRDGSTKETNEPQKILAGLGAGRPLESAVESRMSSVFGHDFSRVRVHTDAQAARLSDHLDARAFTIGNDVAFASGEYKPGTLIGDALIAHELAHVVQQSGEAATFAPVPDIEAGHDLLEEEADESAVGAVVALWGETTAGLKQLARHVKPHLRSGLRLKRCRGGSGCNITPRNITRRAECFRAFTGITFGLSNATAQGAGNNAVMEPGSDSRGRPVMRFHAATELQYTPTIRICAPNSLRAYSFVAGMIQNLISSERRAIYDNGAEVSVVFRAHPLPLRDGRRRGESLSDDLFTEEANVFRAPDNTVTLRLPDVPGYSPTFHLRDTTACNAETDAMLNRIIVRDRFRTWAAVKSVNEQPPCAARLHHIDWDTDWEGTVSFTNGQFTSLSRSRGRVNITQANGNGAPEPRTGDPVANEASTLQCTPGRSAPAAQPVAPPRPRQ